MAILQYGQLKKGHPFMSYRLMEPRLHSFISLKSLNSSFHAAKTRRLKFGSSPQSGMMKSKSRKSCYKNNLRRNLNPQLLAYHHRDKKQLLQVNLCLSINNKLSLKSSSRINRSNLMTKFSSWIRRIMSNMMRIMSTKTTNTTITSTITTSFCKKWPLMNK
jgi:hypothetical protein